MKLAPLYRLVRGHQIVCGKTNLLQYRCFQPDLVPRDSNTKPKRYKYPAVYEPYGPRLPPSDKIIQLAEKIAALPQEERVRIGQALHFKVCHPRLEQNAIEGLDAGTQAGARGGKGEEKKAEKTTFDVKLEKFDPAAKLKVIKEIRSFTDLGLKEAKDLVEKAPVTLKKQVTKDEANNIIEKLKAIGGVAVME